MAFTDDRTTLQKSLDLLQTKPQTKEEVQNLLYKLPELKLRPERISEEVVTIDSWAGSKKYPYLNPVPGSMIHVDIQQLSKVDIDWKMLTLERPQTILEIQIFSRIVLLSKMTLKCVEKEKQFNKRIRGRSRVVICAETDECFTYEYFSRAFVNQERGQGIENAPKTPPQPPQNVEKSAVEVEEPVPSLFEKVEKKKRRKRLRRRKPKKKLKKRRRRKTKTVLPKLRKRKKKSSPRKKGEHGKTLMQMLKASEKSEKRKLADKTIEV